MEWEGSGAWVNFLVKVVCVCVSGYRAENQVIFFSRKGRGFFRNHS